MPAMGCADYIGLGFCSNDHLAVLPFIPMDTKVRMLSHAIMGGGPAANSTAGAATLAAAVKINDKINRAFAGAAAAMGCRLEVHDLNGYAPRNNNAGMNAVFQAIAADRYGRQGALHLEVPLSVGCHHHIGKCDRGVGGQAHP